MDINQFASIINNQLQAMDSIAFNRIINNNTRLRRLSILNRIVILAQCRDASDVRTYDEWEYLGIHVNKNASYINIAFPVISNKYTDIKTGRILEEGELNSAELIKALEYGIINKVEDIDSIEIKKAYDISSTNAYTKEMNRFNNLATIKRDAYKINDKLYNYIKDTNSYNELAIQLADYFKVMCSVHNSIIDEAISYSIHTIFDKRYKEVEYSDITQDELISIFCYLDEMNSFIDGIISNDKSTSNSLLITKAKAILATLEANKVYKKLHR